MVETRKIIGLSCGRVNGNSEILLKEALMGAEEIGVGSEHGVSTHLELIKGLQIKFFTEDQEKVKELMPKYASYGNIVKP